MAYDNLEIAADKLSKINSAALINQRLSNIWVDANRHSRAAQYSSWNADLDCVWRELGGDVGKDSDEEKDFIKINEALAKTGTIKNWKGTIGFKKITKEQEKTQASQYTWLMEKEIFLRRLQNKQGKGTAYEKGWEAYLTG